MGHRWEDVSGGQGWTQVGKKACRWESGGEASGQACRLKHSQGLRAEKTGGSRCQGMSLPSVDGYLSFLHSLKTCLHYKTIYTYRNKKFKQYKTLWILYEIWSSHLSHPPSTAADTKHCYRLSTSCHTFSCALVNISYICCFDFKTAPIIVLQLIFCCCFVVFYSKSYHSLFPMPLNITLPCFKGLHGVPQHGQTIIYFLNTPNCSSYLNLM